MKIVNENRTALRRPLLVTMLVSSGLLLSACDIEQTRDGELPDVDVSVDTGKLPEYEVVKTEEGRAPDVDVDAEGGQLPAYDVDMAEMEIETETVEVEVPTDVDVKMPDEQPENDSQ